MSELLSTDPELHRMPSEQDLGRLQFTTLLYYLHCTNPDNGLVRDKTAPDAPASIAAVGMALATIPVVVERGIIIRQFAAKIARRRLEFLLSCPQGQEPDASGYKGFFYHFLDIESGRRVWQCELSTINFGVSSPGHSLWEPTLTAPTQTRLKFAAWLKRFTSEPTGAGLAITGSRSRTVGGQRAVLSLIVGADTTRASCSTSSDLARPHTRYLRNLCRLHREL